MPTSSFAHMPFFPEDFGDLTVGSFVTGITEDAIIAAVWRLRTWNLYGQIYVTRDPVTGHPGPTLIYDAPNPSYLTNGESNIFGLETAAFTDLDDILVNWRKTASESSGVNGSVAGASIFWGPRGGYDISGGTSGGALDSEIFFTFEDGDEIGYLGSQFGRVIDGSGHTLSNAADIDFTFVDVSGHTTSVPLYFDNISPDPGSILATDWTGTLVMQPGVSWWPWTINGDDTWDTTDGTQLENPLRLRTTGEPARLCQQA